MHKSIFSFFCGAHDANLSVYVDGNLYTIELERIFGNRHFRLNHLMLTIDAEDQTSLYGEICIYLKKLLESRGVFRPSFDVGLFEWYTPEELTKCMVDFFDIKEVHVQDGNYSEEFVEKMKLKGSKGDLCWHHRAHAAGAFYSSGFDEALVVSHDGSGNDGSFCVYEMSKENPNLNQINEYDLTPFPTKYASLGRFISEIKKAPGPLLSNLTNAGKVMGLSAYGSLSEDYMRRILPYFESDPYEVNLDFLENFGDLKVDEFQGKESYDLAFCAQLAFEQCTLKRFYKFFDEKKHKNVCITGGGALNVLLNEKLSKTHPNTNFFVPCSPGDSGLSYGMIANYLKKEVAPELMYTGCEILDKETLPYILDHRPWEKATPQLIAKELEKGKIIGICRGNSETGPRALGNRSILADPRSHQAKDIINKKVKFREWYRPFAPICKEESASTYFETSSNVNYKYMSYSPPVRKEFRNLLPAVTHIDGTSRLQTLSADQNGFVYEILNEFEKITNIPVLVNTSFNSRGRSILTRYLEATKVLDSTELDAVVLEDYYVYK